MTQALGQQNVISIVPPGTVELHGKTTPTNGARV